jgi:hypothetical protein
MRQRGREGGREGRRKREREIERKREVPVNLGHTVCIYVQLLVRRSYIFSHQFFLSFGVRERPINMQPEPQYDLL